MGLASGQNGASPDAGGELREKLSALPNRPGVYLMKNAAGEVIYVGKAVSLRNRVRSYFQSPAGLSAKVRVMAAQVADIDYIVTGSEVEALILEANLIKEHRPRYNVRLRDDKAYPYLKVTVNEPYPRVVVSRRVEQDGARYFGPYTNAHAVRETTRFLRKLFPIRTCSLDLSGDLNYRPCLLYHIRRCVGPCAGRVEPEEYDRLIEQVCLFLEGRHERLLPELYQRMKAAAAALEFERAARIRDQIRAIESVTERQKIVSTRAEDQDVIGFAREADAVCVQIFYVRGGRLIGREHFFMEATADDEPGEIMRAFIQQYYQRAAFVPQEILLQAPVEDEAAIEGWLREQRGGAVRLRVPKRGEKRRLVEMVAENARLVLKERLGQLARRTEEAEKAMAQLADVLGLPNVPQRIEAFDISNIQGNQAVASMVVFEDGLPKPADYRRFKIRTKSTPDDFAMMREVVHRRFLRGLQEQSQQVEERGFGVFPDLVLIDGGKGQLSAAREVMRELGVEDIPAIGLAKQLEQVFVEGRPDPVELPWASPGLKLLQRIRDEAHRYAITYHRRLRDQRTTRSVLDDIPGVGPRRKRELIKRFGSVAGVRRATVDEIAAVPGISRSLAERIALHLRG
ncbi:MAG: excinuclease ABC subunit UvrC [Firmicutes bacterium]|nr:excinuclease ABC subunit UvrC [Bacillota bacterium]